MNLARVSWYSDVLLRQTNLVAVVPDRPPTPDGWPVLYLLHGMMDDSDCWTTKGRLGLHAAGYPMLIVTPDAANGYYTDNVAGERWFTHVADELPAFVERTFRARTDRGGRGVGGLSMGGYGAMRLSLGRPERYISAHSHSGALTTGSEPPAGDHADRFRRVFGDDPRGTDHDLLTLAERVADLPPGERPTLRIDCGRDDFLLGENEAFHDRLVNLGLDHTYELNDGAHTWDYWDRHLPAALAFHADAFGIERNSGAAGQG